MTATTAKPAGGKKTKTILKLVLLILGVVLCVLGVFALISYNRKDMNAANAAAMLKEAIPFGEKLLYMLYAAKTPVLVLGVLLTVVSLIIPSEETELVYGEGNRYWKRLLNDLVRDKWLYVLLLPGFLYFVVFKYLPMWGIVISFKKYVPASGVFDSEYVGLKYFEYFFKTPAWQRYLSNTLILSVMSIVFTFPAPIILALLLNEMQSLRYKKLMQTFLYVPHFISIVIVVSITYVMFGTDGIIYKATAAMLGHPIDYLTDQGVFRWMIVGQNIWKETGWGTIIFLAALTNVDVQLYEAAMVDGAGRLRRLWHITLPAIRSTIVLMLVLRMGSVLDSGYEHLILMSNAMNRSVSETLDVFVYQQGIKLSQFSYATAVGLMKSVVSLILVMSSNKIAHLLGEPGLY